MYSFSAVHMTTLSPGVTPRDDTEEREHRSQCMTSYQGVKDRGLQPAK